MYANKIASIYPSGCNLTSKDEGVAAFKVLKKKIASNSLVKCNLTSEDEDVAKKSTS